MCKGPTFFKFFISEINNIDMKIPVDFTRDIGQALPEKVFFRDQHEDIWPIKVAKVGGFWYFVDGWNKFVDDNMLTTGDLMVFEYYCKSVFNIKLYGKFATEKNVDKPSILDGVKKEQIQEYDDDIHEIASDENNSIIESDHYDQEDKDETEDDEGVLVRPPLNNHREVEEQELDNDGAIVGINTHARRTYVFPKCYGMEIFEAGLAKQPRNPYFVSRIMPKRKSNLFIPHDVIKDYSVKLENEVILVDPSGREYIAKFSKWKNGRSVLSGGWGRMCKVNSVALEDLCICEFVPKEGDERQFLHVSFVRGDTMQTNG